MQVLTTTLHLLARRSMFCIGSRATLPHCDRRTSFCSTCRFAAIAGHAEAFSFVYMARTELYTKSLFDIENAVGL
jgi:hypothetical protein